MIPLRVSVSGPLSEHYSILWFHHHRTIVLAPDPGLRLRSVWDQAGGGGASSGRGSGSGVTSHNDSNSPGEHTGTRPHVRSTVNNMQGAKSEEWRKYAKIFVYCVHCHCTASSVVCTPHRTSAWLWGSVIMELFLAERWEMRWLAGECWRVSSELQEK